MDKIEKIEEFYQRKFDWVPQNIHNEIGHFNIFKIEPIDKDKVRPISYKRRDFYKITFVVGKNRIEYADKVIEIQKQAMVFSNPFIPYSWEHVENEQHGFYCIFTQDFFHQYGDLSQYEVFQPNGTHVFDLSDDQVVDVDAMFTRIYNEINSDYIHKYDMLRTIVFELLHYAMKMQPSMTFDKQPINASKRISVLFLELLERQFPIDENHQQIALRSASDFANQLNVHVNHLNRAVRETSAKTTSQLIAERILQEAKILLRHSAWSVAEISNALGFTEVTHFNNFFKKHLQTSPLKFRNV